MERQKKRRGCVGCGCWTLGVFLVIGLLLGGWVAVVQFGVRERLGLYQPPAEKLLSGTPDRVAAEEILNELHEGHIDPAGISLYVLPIEGTDRSVAYAVLDSAEGFAFSLSGDEDPFIGLLERLGTGPAATEANIDRVAIDYRKASGETLVLLTAPTQALQQFRRGEIDRETMLAAIEGKANLASLYVDLYTELRQ